MCFYFSDFRVLYKDKCLYLVPGVPISSFNRNEQDNFKLILKDMLPPSSWSLLVLPRKIRDDNFPSFYCWCKLVSFNIDSDTGIMLINYWKDKVK